MRNGLTLILIPLICYNLSVMADTCPKPESLLMNKKGVFYSTQKPGWQAYKPSLRNAKVESDGFKGAVLSPEHGRIACIYLDSNKHWVAIVSNKKHAYSVDDLALKSWKYNELHTLVLCGTPEHSRQECQFRTD